MEKLNKYIKIAIILSSVYVAATYVPAVTSMLKDQSPLLWVSTGIAAINMIILLMYIFRGGKINISVILLNIVQLALFMRLHIQIYDMLGPEHYSSASPLLPDWVKFIALQTLKAADLPDIIEAYRLTDTPAIQNIGFMSHKSALSGIALLGMQTTVGIFTAGFLFRLITRSPDQPEGGILKWIRLAGLLVSIAGMVVFGWWYKGWYMTTLFLFPLDSILVSLDVGDACQIFAWRLLPTDMDTGLASAAVLFRVIAIWYLILLIHGLYLRISKNLQSVEELAKVCVSPEYHSVEDRLRAIKKLEELGTFADPAIPYLIKVLADSDPDIREAATGALDEIDSEWPESEAARRTVPDLVKSLLNKEKVVRDSAADALERIDPEWTERESARSLVPNLVNALFEKDRDVQIAGAEALGKIGPAAQKAVPQLIKALSAKDKDVRRAVAGSLGKTGPSEEAVSPLIKVLADEDVTDKASESLGQMGPEAIPQLIGSLGEPDRNIRNGAASALEMIDPDWRKSDQVRELTARFLNIMGDSFSSKRSGAIDALGIIGSPEVIPQLINILADSEEDVRRAAGEALEKIDPDWQKSDTARKTVPKLMKALTDNDPGVRRAAAEALEKIDPDWQKSDIARKALPQFVKALKNTLETVRIAAAGALGEMGQGAVKAVPYLVKALADKEKGVREAVGESLEKITPKWRQSKSIPQILPGFIKELEHEDWEVRNAAASALGRIGPAAARIIPTLGKLLTDTDKRVRETAVTALDKIDPGWREGQEILKALPYIIKALGDSRWIVRLSSVEALAQIGAPIAETAAPYLAKALKDSAVDVRSAAEKALDGLDPDGTFREKEIGDVGYVQSASEKALGEVDPESAEVITHLVKKLIDSDRSVRKAAKAELEKIDPEWRRNKSAMGVIPYLAKEGLSDSRWVVRSSTAQAIGEFGTAAAKLAPRLTKVMNTDSSADVQGAAKKALEKIKA